VKKITRRASKSKKPRGGSKKKEKEGLLFVLSGPSGSGKTTLAEKILTAPVLKGRLIKSVSFTTRAKRPGEVEGRDYFFITPREFQRQHKAKRILEWTRYLEYYYGTPKGFVDRRLRQGKHLLMCLDIHGARRIKRLYPRNTVTIFIEPPSLETLRQRLLRRSDKTDHGEIQRRVGLAKAELMAAHTYRYRLVNADLD
jgi:guanylate kinase